MYRYAPNSFGMYMHVNGLFFWKCYIWVSLASWMHFMLKLCSYGYILLNLHLDIMLFSLEVKDPFFIMNVYPTCYLVDTWLVGFHMTWDSLMVFVMILWWELVTLHEVCDHVEVLCSWEGNFVENASFSSWLCHMCICSFLSCWGCLYLIFGYIACLWLIFSML
jgi:hypothetical protein